MPVAVMKSWEDTLKSHTFTVDIGIEGEFSTGGESYHRCGSYAGIHKNASGEVCVRIRTDYYDREKGYDVPGYRMYPLSELVSVWDGDTLLR